MMMKKKREEEKEKQFKQIEKDTIEMKLKYEKESKELEKNLRLDLDDRDKNFQKEMKELDYEYNDKLINNLGIKKLDQSVLDLIQIMKGGNSNNKTKEVET